EVASLSLGKSLNYQDTKAVLNQAVADLSVAHSILHQVHWYMRGAGFMIWHPKMDEYMDELDGYLDEMSERLITLGGTPFSTLVEFSENSQLKEVPGSYSLTLEQQ
ncbi:DNA starvation/stationary phase protection protein, partial [Streptococcus suis]